VRKQPLASTLVETLHVQASGGVCQGTQPFDDTRGGPSSTEAQVECAAGLSSGHVCIERHPRTITNIDGKVFQVSEYWKRKKGVELSDHCFVDGRRVWCSIHKSYWGVTHEIEGNPSNGNWQEASTLGMVVLAVMFACIRQSHEDGGCLIFHIPEMALRICCCFFTTCGYVDLQYLFLSCNCTGARDAHELGVCCMKSH